MADPRALFDLSGKVACVTGASSGLGRRAADVLFAAGIVSGLLGEQASPDDERASRRALEIVRAARASEGG